MITQAICGEAERRRWEIVDYEGAGSTDHAGVAMVVRGHAYPLELQELTETLPFSEVEIREWREQRSWGGRQETGEPPPQLKRRRAIGRLALQLPHSTGAVA